MEDNNIKELLQELQEINRKLAKPKRDYTTWFSLFSSFLSTVVIAGLSLYYAQQEKEKNINLQKANFKLEQLKMLNSLVPSLTSKDTSIKNTAIRILKAASSTENIDLVDGVAPAAKADEAISGVQPSKRNNDEADISIISNFAALIQIAESTDKPVEERKRALLELKNVATSTAATVAIRENVAAVATKISVSDESPELRSLASEVISSIKMIPVAAVSREISSRKMSRRISTIIVHSTTPFSSQKYQGLSSVVNLAKFQASNYRWNTVSWHYLIAPDGAIWSGAPLNERAIHAERHNKSSISILLFCDGNIEGPTSDQTNTLKSVLEGLQATLQLPANSIQPHSYFNPRKSCPGVNIDQKYLAGLLD